MSNPSDKWSAPGILEEILIIRNMHKAAVHLRGSTGKK